MKLESRRMCIIKKEPGVEDTLSGAKIEVKAEQKSFKLNSTNLNIWNTYIGAHVAPSVIKQEPGAEDSRAKRDDKAEQKSSKLNSTNLKTWHAFIGANGESKVKIESTKEFLKPSLTDFLKGDFFSVAHTDSTYVQSAGICPFCNKKIPSEKKFNRHLKFHTAVTSWKCEICQLAFLNKSHLTRHIRVHSREKPFQCYICTKTFSERVGLVSHLRWHTRGEYRCTICERTYIWPSGLSRHLKTHTDKKARTSTECKKGYTTRGSMRKHKKSNTGCNT